MKNRIPPEEFRFSRTDSSDLQEALRAMFQSALNVVNRLQELNFAVAVHPPTGSPTVAFVEIAGPGKVITRCKVDVLCEFPDQR